MRQFSKLDFTTQKNAKTALNIEKWILRYEVSDLSNKLLQITSASENRWEVLWYKLKILI